MNIITSKNICRNNIFYPIHNDIVDLEQAFTIEINHSDGFTATTGGGSYSVKFLKEDANLLLKLYNESSENNVTLWITATQTQAGDARAYLIDFEAGISYDGDYFEVNIKDNSIYFDEQKKKFEQGIDIVPTDLQVLTQSSPFTTPTFELSAKEDLTIKWFDSAAEGFPAIDTEEPLSAKSVFQNYNQDDVSAGCNVKIADYYNNSFYSLSYDVAITDNEYQNLFIEGYFKCKTIGTFGAWGSLSGVWFKADGIAVYWLEDGTTLTDVLQPFNFTPNILVSYDHWNGRTEVNFSQQSSLFSVLPKWHKSPNVFRCKVYLRFYIDSIVDYTMPNNMVVIKGIETGLSLSNMPQHQYNAINAMPLDNFLSKIGVNSSLSHFYITTSQLNAKKEGKIKGDLSNFLKDLFYLSARYPHIKPNKIDLESIDLIKSNILVFYIDDYKDFMIKSGENYNTLTFGTEIERSSPFEANTASIDYSTRIEKNIAITVNYTPETIQNSLTNNSDESIIILYAPNNDLAGGSSSTGFKSLNMYFTNWQILKRLARFLFSFITNSDVLKLEKRDLTVYRFTLNRPSDCLFDKNIYTFTFHNEKFSPYNSGSLLKVLRLDNKGDFLPIKITTFELDNNYEVECLKLL